MGTANLVRTALQQAQGYAKKKQSAKEPPPPNLKFEALELALNRKIPVIFAAHRSDDILTGLRLAKEFQLKPMLTQATEGYLLTDVLAEANVPVVVHPTMMQAQLAGDPQCLGRQRGLLGRAQDPAGARHLV